MSFIILFTELEKGFLVWLVFHLLHHIITLKTKGLFSFYLFLQCFFGDMSVSSYLHCWISSLRNKRMCLWLIEWIGFSLSCWNLRLMCVFSLWLLKTFDKNWLFGIQWIDDSSTMRLFRWQQLSLFILIQLLESSSYSHKIYGMSSFVCYCKNSVCTSSSIVACLKHYQVVFLVPLENLSRIFNWWSRNLTCFVFLYI